MKKNEISVKKIANFLDLKYTGKDFKISNVSSLNKIKNNSLLFYSDISNFQFKIKDNTKYNLKKLQKHKNIVIITTEDIVQSRNNYWSRTYNSNLKKCNFDGSFSPCFFIFWS